MVDLAHLLTDDSTVPRYMQIVAGLRQQISSGAVTPGTRLPASRALAQDLGIARSTVVAAYDQLVAEGYLDSRRGAGVFACDIAPLASAQTSRTTAAPAPQPSEGLLAPGSPDPAVFPTLPWARCVSRVARNSPAALVHAADPFGDPQLRREIAAYAGRWRGIEASAEQVLVTNGASAALELTLRLLDTDGDLALEAPGYVPTQRFAAARGWQPNWLRVGTQGAALPKHPSRITVLTPSHQFPLGGTLPVPERQAFLAAAAECDGWIIEDDFDSEFRYSGAPVPAMAALDRGGRCIYVGTFSKTFSHALRLGYLILPPDLVPLFREATSNVSTTAPITAQRPLAEFMASGQYDRHIRRARRLYAQRYTAAVAALSDWPQALGHFHRHNAGMQIAFHLRDGLQDRKMVVAAQAEGFAIRALSECDPVRRQQGLLIGFCQSGPEHLGDQIARLGAVLTQHSDPEPKP